MNSRTVKSLRGVSYVRHTEVAPEQDDEDGNVQPRCRSCVREKDLEETKDGV